MTAVSAQEKAAVASIGGRHIFPTTIGDHQVRVTYSIESDGQVVLWSMVHGDDELNIHPDYFTEWQMNIWAGQACADYAAVCERINTNARIDAYQAAREAA